MRESAGHIGGGPLVNNKHQHLTSREVHIKFWHFSHFSWENVSSSANPRPTTNVATTGCCLAAVTATGEQELWVCYSLHRSLLPPWPWLPFINLPAAPVHLPAGTVYNSRCGGQCVPDTPRSREDTPREPRGQWGRYHPLHQQERACADRHCQPKTGVLQSPPHHKRKDTTAHVHHPGSPRVE